MPLDLLRDQATPTAESADQEQTPSIAIEQLISFSRAEAWRIVGGLSKPSKMPCYAWGVPAQSCQVGAKLAEIEGSVCQSCYAFKGFFRTHKVQRSYERRLERSDDPQWIDAMAKLVYWQAVETGELYFRWFDSGDLQSLEMLQRIVAVVGRTPEIRHWLPTREYRIIAEYQRRYGAFPPNLVVRVSAPLVDGLAPKAFGLPTSTVHSEGTGQGFACTAYERTPANCGECRVCWDGAVGNVSYRLH